MVTLYNFQCKYQPLTSYFFKLTFTGIYLTYNVVLVLGVQQSNSVIHIIYYLFFRLFPHISHYKVLSRVSCAIQEVLITWLGISMRHGLPDLPWSSSLPTTLLRLEPSTSFHSSHCIKKKKNLKSMFIGMKYISITIKQRPPTFLAPGLGFMEDSSSTDQGRGRDFRMIQVHYIDLNFISVIIPSAPLQMIRH